MNEDRAAEHLKLAREDAAAACERLRIAIEKYAYKWGWRHGIRADQALALLLDRKKIA